MIFGIFYKIGVISAIGIALSAMLAAETDISDKVKSRMINPQPEPPGKVK